MVLAFVEVVTRGEAGSPAPAPTGCARTLLPLGPPPSLAPSWSSAERVSSVALGLASSFSQNAYLHSKQARVFKAISSALEFEMTIVV